MSNPDSSTPSIQALNLAVKPAGYSSWGEFEKAWQPLAGISKEPHSIALAYAADLDKADKQNREVLALLAECVGYHKDVALLEAAKVILRANLLPDPIDPDLLEAREIKKQWHKGEQAVEDYFLAAIKRGRELAKEQDRG